MIKSFAGLGSLAFLVISILTASCSLVCIDGEGNIASEDRNPGSFHSIKLKIPARVILEQGQQYQTRIEAEQNLIPLIKTEITRERLEITAEKCIGSTKGITIYITVPEIELLSIEGSGSVVTASPINGGRLELVINGSGTMKLEATAELLFCGLKGSGQIEISGSSKQQYVKITGSGVYNAASFATAESEIAITGSGLAEVFTIDKLKAEIDGSGEIRYKGNPTLKSQINGSGGVNRIE